MSEGLRVETTVMEEEEEEEVVDRRSSRREGRKAVVEGVEYAFVNDIPSDCLCFLCGQVRERRAGREGSQLGCSCLCYRKPPYQLRLLVQILLILLIFCGI